MSWNGRETLLNVQEFLLDVREWSGDPPKCPGVVERPSQMFGSGRETLSDDRE